MTDHNPGCWRTLAQALARQYAHNQLGATLAIGMLGFAALAGGWPAIVGVFTLLLLTGLTAGLADWHLARQGASAAGTALGQRTNERDPAEAAIRAWTVAEAEAYVREQFSRGPSSDGLIRSVGTPPELVDELPPAAQRFLLDFMALAEPDGTEIGWPCVAASTLRPGNIRIGLEPDCQGEWSISRDSEGVLYVERDSRFEGGEAVEHWPSIWHVAAAMSCWAGDRAEPLPLPLADN